MKNSNSNIFKGSLIAGAFIATAGLSVSASSLVSYNNLGSGSEIRASLLESASRAVNFKTLELKCGDAMKTDTAAAKKAGDKMKDAKCGKDMKDMKHMKDSKKADAVKETTKEGAKTETKMKDAKCGEGKCGVN
ncbi:MAG: hypothetical protein Q8M08_14005 [Bacteroidales bacterium]|nr:hypothetical protein [Bacteroidales bacterium]